MLLVLAVLIRSIGGTEERFPFSLAVLAPLGALAVISRSSPDDSLQLWIAVGAIAVVLVRSLLYIPRLSSVALALTAAGLFVPPEAQAVAWASLAAVLVADIRSQSSGRIPYCLVCSSHYSVCISVNRVGSRLARARDVRNSRPCDRLALAAPWQPSLASQPGGRGLDCAACWRGNLGLLGRWMAAEI